MRWGGGGGASLSGLCRGALFTQPPARSQQDTTLHATRHGTYYITRHKMWTQRAQRATTASRATHGPHFKLHTCTRPHSHHVPSVRLRSCRASMTLGSEDPATVACIQDGAWGGEGRGGEGRGGEGDRIMSTRQADLVPRGLPPRDSSTAALQAAGRECHPNPQPPTPNPTPITPGALTALAFKSP
jgi:hypothetical protein